MLSRRQRIQRYAWGPRNNNSSFVKKIFLLIPIAIFLILIFFSFSKFKEAIFPISGFIEVKDKKDTITIENTIKDALKGESGTYSFFVKNLKTGEEGGVGEHEVYETASLYKLWIAAEVEERLVRRQITKEDEIKEDVVKLNEQFNIASEEAEIAEGEIDTTVNDALYKMITISDNYSALVLSKLIGLSKVSGFLNNYGFSESSLNPPKSTAYDIGQFYQLLYNSRIINSAASKDILELLKAQRLNDRIPKYLPEDLEVAHKTGELGPVKHDAGIVFTPFGDYIFVAMSKTNNPLHAAEVIAKVSKEIYSYFEKESEKNNSL